MRSPCTVLLTLCLIACAGPVATAAPRDSRLAAVDSWAFAIGSGNLTDDRVARLAAFDLVVVDGEEVTSDQVSRLRAGGAIVLSYLSVGTIERGRSWYRRARRHRLDYWGDWGEWYANVSRRGFRNLIVRSVAPTMLAKGVDGLFLDNVDMIEDHRRQRRGMRVLVARTSRLVHAGGGFLFAQNGASVVGPMLHDLDGWNREDLGYGYDFDRRRYRRAGSAETRAAQRELARIGSSGLLTLATSYTRGAIGDRTRAGVLACAVGALPFVSNISLTRIGTPQVCPQPPA